VNKPDPDAGTGAPLFDAWQAALAAWARAFQWSFQPWSDMAAANARAFVALCQAAGWPAQRAETQAARTLPDRAAEPVQYEVIY
jgi:hypothetical protein